LTANPKSRKGSNISQITGYKINAINAIGQQRMKRMSQRRNLIIYFTFFEIKLQSLYQVQKRMQKGFWHVSTTFAVLFPDDLNILSDSLAKCLENVLCSK
jgi:hypothetical protein